MVSSSVNTHNQRITSVQKPPPGTKETKIEQPATGETKRPKDPLANVFVTKPKTSSADSPAIRPKNPSANVLPSEGYVLEIDGKFKSEHGTSEEAMAAGLELKTRFPQIQVNVFDAKARARTLVTLAEQSGSKAE
jgi:hypothetical protein